jgi:RNA polymerase sigma factor (sigma-70 family)
LHYLFQSIGVTPVPNQTDRALLEQFISERSEAAFEAVMQRHGPMVLGLCRGILRDIHEAEDAFQATFLVLARKAGSVRKQESLAAWLHSVACRIALRARARGARRQLQEKQVPAMIATEPGENQESIGLLHEELNRLPDKYRVPVVLCDLQGMTHAQAASELGVSRVTVTERLGQARERLRGRLARRGVTLSAAAVATSLADSARAALPASLIQPTLQAAIGFAQGQALASTEVAALVNGALHTMLLTRWTIAAAVMLALAMLAGGAGIWTHQAFTSPVVAEQVAPKQPANLKSGPAVEDRTDMHGDPLPAGAVARLGTLRWRHAGVRSLAFSRDGKTAVSGGLGGAILWDCATGRALRHFPTPAQHVGTVCFSPDEKILAAGTFHQTIWLWDTSTGHELRHFGKRQHQIRHLAFSADGKSLLSCDGHISVACWNVATGEAIEPSADRLNLGGKVALSPDAKTLVTWHVGASNVVRCYTLCPGKPFDDRKSSRDIGQHQTAIQCATFSADGRLLITGSSDPGDKQIRVWEVETGKQLQSLPGYGVQTNSLAVSPDGKTLFSAGYEKVPTLNELKFVESMRAGEGLGQVRDLGSGKEICRLPPLDGQAFFGAAVFSADGKTLAELHSSAIRRWDAATGKPMAQPDGPLSSIGRLVFAPSDKVLAMQAVDNVIRLWDPVTGQEVRQLAAPAGTLTYQPVFSPDGKLLASNGSDRMIRLWDVDSGKEYHHFQAEPQRVAFLGFTSGGKVLIHQSYAGPVCFWDVASRRELLRTQRDNLVNVEASLGDGRLLLNYHRDRNAKDPAIPRFSAGGGRALWDPETDREVGLGFLPHGEVAAPALAPNGRILAALNTSRMTVSLFDVKTGKKLQALPRPFRDPYGPATRLEFSPDGRLLATADSQDAPVLLWDAATGRLLGQFAGHPGGVVSLHFSSDGALLASGGADSTALVWDVKGAGRLPAPRNVPRTPQEMDELWTALAARLEKTAYQAVWDLAASPDLSVPFLREKLQPAAPIDSKRLEQLIANLDANELEKRQRATEELENLGDAAEEALIKLLASKPAHEVRQRAESILKKLEATLAERLRPLRALEALEHVGTSEAKQLLAKLAKGEPASPLTREAQASLERLGRRSSLP